jgi:hypothetical protein
VVAVLLDFGVEVARISRGLGSGQGEDGGEECCAEGEEVGEEHDGSIVVVGCVRGRV